MASSEVYDVEEILGRRFKNGREEYQIKWIGYEETTWEPRSNLNCPEKLRAFLDQLNPRASETRKKLEAIGDGEVESDSIISSETQSSSPSDDEIEYLSKPQPSDNARNEFLHKLKKRVKPLDHKKPLESSQHISRNPLSSSSNLKKIPQKLGGKIQKKVKQQKNPRKTNLRKEKGKGSSDDVEKSPDEARGSITNQYYKENPDKKIQNGNKSNIQSTKMNKFYLEPDAKVYSNVRNPLQVNEPQPGPSKPSEISQKNSKANLQFNQSKRAQKTSNFNSDNKDNGGASDEDFIPHEKSIKIREGDMQKTKPANQEWNPSSNEETLKKKIWGMQVAKKTTRNETIFPMEWERSLPETTLYRKWEGNLYKGKKQNFVSRVEIHPLTEKSDEGLYSSIQHERSLIIASIIPENYIISLRKSIFIPKNLHKMKYVGRGDKFEKEISRLKWNGMIAMVWIPIAEPRDLLIICPITPEICQDFDIKFEPSESCILFRLPLSMVPPRPLKQSRVVHWNI